MDADDARNLLVNAMGSLFVEAEMEATIAEANGLSRNEYNKMIEEGLELPEYIKKYRELNRQKQLYEERLIKHELKESGELLTKSRLIQVFALYPQFQEDYKLLKEHGYIAETELGLKWQKKKQALAEYFGKLPKQTEKVPWKEIENLFEVKNLKNNLSKNGNVYKNLSEDYIKLQTILPRKDLASIPESK